MLAGNLIQIVRVVNTKQQDDMMLVWTREACVVLHMHTLMSEGARKRGRNSCTHDDTHMRVVPAPPNLTIWSTRGSLPEREMSWLTSNASMAVTVR